MGSDKINPRTLSLVFLVMGSIAAPSVMCTAVSKGRDAELHASLECLELCTHSCPW